MAVRDRAERFSNVRAGLDYPFAQSPNPDQILREMLAQEQMLILRLTNKRRPWTLISSTITTVDGTDTYTITQPISANQASGKVHFVARATNNTDVPFLNVPFDDFPDVEYGKMPPSGEVNASLTVPEKISFYRTGVNDQAYKAVISPTPQESGLVYTIWFLTGYLDKAYALTSQTGVLVELSDYLDLKTQFHLLGRSKWSDDEDANKNKRLTLGAGFERQIAEYEPIVERYISELNAPESFEMGFWNDDD